MPHGHSHGGVACDGNHGKTEKGGRRGGRGKSKNNGRNTGSGKKSKGRNKKNVARKIKKKRGKHVLPCCACKDRGLPRHCCCHELCCGWNGCGPRHNIAHLPLMECLDKKKYRPGQRRRHSRCFYCYRNLGNWLTLLFTLIGLGGAIVALALYLAPCTPNITFNVRTVNRTIANSSVVKQVNYKYDGANVVLMMDYSGSITGEWQDEVKAAEAVINIFKQEMNANSPFRAAALKWSSDVNYLTTDSNVDAVLTADIDIIDRALAYAKTPGSPQPSGGTNFFPAFGQFYIEIKERSTGAVDVDPNNVHHNFAIFITDGDASDYDISDKPFSSDQGSQGTGGETKDKMCVPLGWPDKDCTAANVIRTIKDMPNTRVLGIFVGDSDDGSAAVHSVSSCDSYTYDYTTKTSPCPYFTSASDFAQLNTALASLMAGLAAEVSVTSSVVTEERQVQEEVTDEIREEVITCEKNTDTFWSILIKSTTFLPRQLPLTLQSPGSSNASDYLI